MRPRMRRIRRELPLALRTAAIAALLSATRLGELCGQETIPSAFACPDCRIDVARIAELGRDTTSLVTTTSTVCRARSGHFFVSALTIPSRVAVYSGNGTLLRTFGREGAGPGEFARIVTTLCGTDERLRIFDTANGRISILTEGGSLVDTRVFRAGWFDGAVLLPDGSSAVSTTIGTPGSVGHPIHIFGPDGAFVRSIGRADGRPQRENAVLDRRILASAPNGQLWTGKMNRYEIDLWSTDGVHRRTIARTPSWFQPWVSIDPGEPFFARPQPRLLSIYEDPEGLLWTSSLVPALDWEPSSRDEFAHRMGGPTVAELDPKWDSIIEVIDPANGRLRHAGRLRGLAFQFIGNGLAYRPREAPDGTHYLEVVWMRLVDP